MYIGSMVYCKYIQLFSSSVKCSKEGSKMLFAYVACVLYFFIIRLQPTWKEARNNVFKTLIMKPAFQSNCAPPIFYMGKTAEFLWV
jgi:hypothetical protein